MMVNGSNNQNNFSWTTTWIHIASLVEFGQYFQMWNSLGLHIGFHQNEEIHYPSTCSRLLWKTVSHPNSPRFQWNRCWNGALVPLVDVAVAVVESSGWHLAHKASVVPLVLLQPLKGVEKQDMYIIVHICTSTNHLCNHHWHKYV